MQVILGEEVAASKLTLSEIAKQITDAIQARAEQGLNYLNCSLSCVCVSIYRGGRDVIDYKVWKSITGVVSLLVINYMLL